MRPEFLLGANSITHIIIPQVALRFYMSFSVWLRIQVLPLIYSLCFEWVVLQKLPIVYILSILSFSAVAPLHSSLNGNWLSPSRFPNAPGLMEQSPASVGRVIVNTHIRPFCCHSKWHILNELRCLIKIGIRTSFVSTNLKKNTGVEAWSYKYFRMLSNMDSAFAVHPRWLKNFATPRAFSESFSPCTSK